MHSTYSFICKYSATGLHQWAGSREAEMDRGVMQGYDGLCLMAEKIEIGLTELDESAITEIYFDRFFR